MASQIFRNLTLDSPNLMVQVGYPSAPQTSPSLMFTNGPSLALELGSACHGAVSTPLLAFLMGEGFTHLSQIPDVLIFPEVQR